MATYDVTIERLQKRKEVVGILILSLEGKIIRSTVPDSMKLQYSQLLSQLVANARDTVHQLDAQDELTFVRLRTKKHEIMLAPEKGYLLVVIQDPQKSG